MRRNTTGTPAPGAARSRRLLLRLGQGALVVLALFLLFEVGIRHVPPDGMTVTYSYWRLDPNCSNCVDSAFGQERYTSLNDQQTIDDYYAAYNRAPVRPAWWRGGCTMSSDPVSVVFTWRGIPVSRGPTRRVGMPRAPVASPMNSSRSISFPTSACRFHRPVRGRRATGGTTEPRNTVRRWPCVPGSALTARIDSGRQAG